MLRAHGRFQTGITTPAEDDAMSLPAPAVPGLLVVPMTAVTLSVQLLPCPGNQPL